MSQFFTSGGQKYWSFSFSISPSMNIQDWFPLGWTSCISLMSKGLLKSLLQHHSSKASILPRSAFFMVQLSHPHITTGKNMALTRQTFVGSGASKAAIWSLSGEKDALPGTLSQLGLQIAVIWDFPVLSKWGYRLSPFDDIYAVEGGNRAGSILKAGLLS